MWSDRHSSPHEDLDGASNAGAKPLHIATVAPGLRGWIHALWRMGVPCQLVWGPGGDV